MTGAARAAKPITSACALVAMKKLTKADLKPGPPEAEAAVKDIAALIGLLNIPKVYSAPVENAIATFVDETPTIIVDPDLLDMAEHATGSKWAPVSILAHELGHLLNAHHVSKGDQKTFELQADHYSGFALARAGATLDEAKAAMAELGSKVDSATHPAAPKRLAAIEAGFHAARTGTMVPAVSRPGSGLVAPVGPITPADFVASPTVLEIEIACAQPTQVEDVRGVLAVLLPGAKDLEAATVAATPLLRSADDRRWTFRLVLPPGTWKRNIGIDFLLVERSPEGRTLRYPAQMMSGCRYDELPDGVQFHSLGEGRIRPVDNCWHELNRWDPLESTCRHASLSIL